VDQDENYNRDGGPACNDVDLLKGQIQTGETQSKADRHVPISSIDRFDILE
jgi:hypothetical protein